MNLKPVNDLIVDAVTKAATSAVAKSAAHSKECKSEDDIKVYSMNKWYGIIGAIGLLIAAGCAFIPDSEDFNLTGKLILVGIFGLLGLLIVLGYLVSRVITDLEKITYRNMFGIEKSIYWMDLKYVAEASSYGDIDICGEKKKIKLYPYFNGFKSIKDTVIKKQPSQGI